MAEGTGDPVLLIQIGLDTTDADRQYAALAEKIGKGLTFGGGASAGGGGPTFAGGGSGPAGGGGAGRSVNERLLQANERLVRDAEELHQLNERALQNARTAQARSPYGAGTGGTDWGNRGGFGGGGASLGGSQWQEQGPSSAKRYFTDPLTGQRHLNPDWVPPRTQAYATWGAGTGGGDWGGRGGMVDPSMSSNDIRRMFVGDDRGTFKYPTPNIMRGRNTFAPGSYPEPSGGLSQAASDAGLSLGDGDDELRPVVRFRPHENRGRNLTYFQRFLAIEGVKGTIDIASAYRQQGIDVGMAMGNQSQTALADLKFRENVAANVPFGVGQAGLLLRDPTGREALSVQQPLLAAAGQDEATARSAGRGAFALQLSQAAQVSAQLGAARQTAGVQAQYDLTTQEIRKQAAQRSDDATTLRLSQRTQLLSQSGKILSHYGISASSNTLDAELDYAVRSESSASRRGDAERLQQQLNAINDTARDSRKGTRQWSDEQVAAAESVRQSALRDIGLDVSATAAGYAATASIYGRIGQQALAPQGPTALSARGAESRQRAAEQRAFEDIGSRYDRDLAAAAKNPEQIAGIQQASSAEWSALQATTTTARRIRAAELNRSEAVAQAQAFGQMQVAAAVASRDPQAIAEAQARAQYAVTVAGARGSDQQALVMQAAAEVRDTAISQSRIQQQSTLAQITGSAAILGRVAARDPYGAIQETGAAEVAQLAFGDPSTLNARRDEQAQRQRVRSQQYGDYLALTGAGLNRRETVAALLAQAAGTGAELYATRAGVASTVGLASEAAMRQSQAGQTGFAQQELNVGVSTLGAQRAQFIQGLDVGEDNINRVNLSPEGGATIKDVLDSIDEGIAQLNEQLVRLTD